MAEHDFHEAHNINPNLNEQQFSLNKINKIKNYFVAEIKVIVKKLLKTTRNKRKNNKIVMLARSKLNSTESKISEALINNEISHEDFMTIINEEKKYRELKESIRMMNSQRIDVEKK